MKKFFKFFAVALVASTVLFSCGKDPVNPDNNDTTGNNPGGNTENTDPTYAATFDGSALELGWAEGLTNGTIYLFQAAKSQDGQSVYFPYIVNYVQEGEVADLELYKDTYYTAGTDQYGDWQLNQVTKCNFSVLDANTHRVSAEIAAEMYNLGDIVNGIAEDEAGCTKGNLTLNYANITFEMASK